MVRIRPLSFVFLGSCALILFTVPAHAVVEPGFDTLALEGRLSGALSEISAELTADLTAKPTSRRSVGDVWGKVQREEETVETQEAQLPYAGQKSGELKVKLDEANKALSQAKTALETATLQAEAKGLAADMAMKDNVQQLRTSTIFNSSRAPAIAKLIVLFEKASTAIFSIADELRPSVVRKQVENQKWILRNFFEWMETDKAGRAYGADKLELRLSVQRLLGLGQIALGQAGEIAAMDAPEREINVFAMSPDQAGGGSPGTPPARFEHWTDIAQRFKPTSGESTPVSPSELAQLRQVSQLVSDHVLAGILGVRPGQLQAARWMSELGNRGEFPGFLSGENYPTDSTARPRFARPRQ